MFWIFLLFVGMLLGGKFSCFGKESYQYVMANEKISEIGKSTVLSWYDNETFVGDDREIMEMIESLCQVKSQFNVIGYLYSNSDNDCLY